MTASRSIRGVRLWLGLGLIAAALAPGTPRAQDAPRGGGLPIEITADTLEVQQRDNVATFIGNVDAVQGDLVLSADRLRVHYRGADGPAGGAPGSSIRRIEAIGSVVLASPEETAEGDAGTYDVTNRVVTLEGGVVLTRGDNVIRGDRLEYDLASGRSTVMAAVPEGEGRAPDERVRAVFVPEGSSDDGAEPDDDGPAPAADPAEGGAAPVPPEPKPGATD